MVSVKTASRVGYATTEREAGVRSLDGHGSGDRRKPGYEADLRRRSHVRGHGSEHKLDSARQALTVQSHALQTTVDRRKPPQAGMPIPVAGKPGCHAGPGESRRAPAPRKHNAESRLVAKSRRSLAKTARSLRYEKRSRHGVETAGNARIQLGLVPAPRRNKS